MLAEEKRLPKIKDGTLGRAKLLSDKNRYIIALIIEKRASEEANRQIMIEALSSLLNVTTELNLASVSICKGDIESTSWPKIKDILDDTFRNYNTKILICTKRISVPPLHDRPHILKEYHDAAIGGHKGVTKIYLRIKARYYWPNMKTDIQSYI